MTFLFPRFRRRRRRLSRAGRADGQTSRRGWELAARFQWAFVTLACFLAALGPGSFAGQPLDSAELQLRATKAHSSGRPAGKSTPTKTTPTIAARALKSVLDTLENNPADESLACPAVSLEPLLEARLRFAFCPNQISLPARFELFWRALRRKSNQTTTDGRTSPGKPLGSRSSLESNQITPRNSSKQTHTKPAGRR